MVKNGYYLILITIRYFLLRPRVDLKYLAIALCLTLLLKCLEFLYINQRFNYIITYYALVIVVWLLF